MSKYLGKVVYLEIEVAIDEEIGSSVIKGHVPYLSQECSNEFGQSVRNVLIWSKHRHLAYDLLIEYTRTRYPQSTLNQSDESVFMFCNLWLSTQPVKILPKRGQ